MKWLGSMRSGAVPVGEISMPSEVRTLTLPLLPWIRPRRPRLR